MAEVNPYELEWHDLSDQEKMNSRLRELAVWKKCCSLLRSALQEKGPSLVEALKYNITFSSSVAQCP